MRSRLARDWPYGISIFGLTLLIFWLSPVHQISDSTYSMLVSQGLLRYGTFALDHYAIPRFEADRTREGYPADGPLYQLEQVEGHLYYYFPPGTSVLSAPFVAIFDGLGISPSKADGAYDPKGEETIQAGLAAILMAALAGVFYYTSRLVLPPGPSATIALCGAFGTQVWSTASRALWSDTWGLLLLAVALFMLLAHEARQRLISGVLLATLLCWTYFVRPTNSIPLFAITIYVIVYGREALARYLLTAAAWLAGFVTYSWCNFKQPLPDYYRAGSLRLDFFRVALAGNLVSPARGLLVYVPAIFFVAYLLIRFRRHLPYPRLLWLALFVVASHILVISMFSNLKGEWWGGTCFGPRYTTGLVPWFVLLAIQGLQALRSFRTEHGAQCGRLERRAALAAGTVLALAGVLINGRGATSYYTWKWTPPTTPTTDAQVREMLWDWRYPQFLAGLIRPPRPRLLPLIETGTRVDLTSPAADKYLWYGWSTPEPGFRWTDERESAFIFSLDQVENISLRLKAGAFIVPGKLDQQEARILLNGTEVAEVSMKGEAAVLTLPLAKELLRPENVLTLELPDAASPKSMGAGDDIRLLGIYVEWMDFLPPTTASSSTRKD